VQLVRPAEPLKPCRDLGVVKVGIVAAIAADDLEHAGVAAFAAALNDAGRLAPEERRGGLPVGINRSERHPRLLLHSPQDRFHIRQIKARRISRRLLQLTLRGNPGRYRHATRTVTPAIAVDVAQICAAYFNPPTMALSTARVWSSAFSNFPVTISPRFLASKFDHLRRRAFI
jgi:hypothetical protein